MTLIERIEKLEQLAPALERVESQADKWKAEIRQIHKDVNVALREDLRALIEKTNVALLVPRIDQIDKILAENATAHRQQQNDTMLKLRDLERRLWAFIAPGIPPSDDVVTILRDQITGQGGDLSKIDDPMLKLILADMVKALGCLG